MKKQPEGVVKDRKEAIYIGRVSNEIVNKDSLEAMTKEEDKKVKGTFKNLENPGQSGYVCCKIYKDQPVFSKWFDDGEEAEIPLSVAKFINTRTQYPVHKYQLDEDGNYTKSTGRIVQRYQFVSKDFS